MSARCSLVNSTYYIYKIYSVHETTDKLVVHRFSLAYIDDYHTTQFAVILFENFKCVT